eukprot:g275.t1
MTDEEIYAMRQEKAAAARELEARLTRALGGAGLRLAVDLSFTASQSDRELRSLGKQLSLAYGYIRKQCVRSPPAMYLCSYAGRVKAILDNAGAGSWTVHRREARVAEVFAGAGHAGDGRSRSSGSCGDIVYLSPDATEPLLSIRPNDVYVIGGIVDRSVTKNLTLAASSRIGRRARCVRLPISEYRPDLLTRRGKQPVLNVDTVVSILAYLADGAASAEHKGARAGNVGGGVDDSHGQDEDEQACRWRRALTLLIPERQASGKVGKARQDEPGE